MPHTLLPEKINFNTIVLFYHILARLAQKSRKSHKGFPLFSQIVHL